MAQLASTQQNCLLPSEQGDHIQNCNWIWSWPVLTPSWWQGIVWLVAGQGQHAEPRSCPGPVLFSSIDVVYRVSYIVARWKEDPEVPGGECKSTVCTGKIQSEQVAFVFVRNCPLWHLASMFWGKRGVDAACPFILELQLVLSVNFLRQLAYLTPTESKRDGGSRALALQSKEKLFTRHKAQ